MKLSFNGQLYVTAVAAAGLLVVGHCITTLLSEPISSEWFWLAALTLLSGSFTIKVPAIPARISVSGTFVFTSVLLFGTCAGTLTVALDALVVTLAARRKTHEPLRILFNLSAAALSIWIAGHTFEALGGLEATSRSASMVLPKMFGPLVAMTAVYFLMNSALVAGALSFERHELPFQLWRKNFLWLSVNYFGGASMAALLVSYTRTVDLTALGIMVPLLVISYLTFKTSLGRVEDAHRHLVEIKTLHLSTIETLATAIDAKDQVTHGHIRRVQQHTLGLARALGIKDEMQLKAIEAAALLHDMGKLVVPEHILNKPSRLTEGEFEKMKLHASVGADILSSIHFPYPVVPIVRHHHEGWDGRGYPDGLKGTQIPLGARILAVVDCYDALTSDRPYRGRMSDDAAVAILLERRGTMYDPLVVDAFIEVRHQLGEDFLGVERNSNQKIAGSAFPKTDTPELGHPAPEWSTSPDLTHALQTVLSSVETELKGSICLVYLKDTKRDDIVVVAARGADHQRLVGLRIALGARVSGWVAANGRPIVDADSRLELGDLAADGSQCIAVPIHSRGTIVGVLSVLSRPRERFSDSVLSFVEHIAKNFDQDPLSSILAREATGRREAISGQRPVVH